MPGAVTKSNVDKPLERLQTTLNREVSSQHWNSSLATLWAPPVMALPKQRCPMGDGPWERVLASSIISLLKAKAVFKPKRIHLIFMVVKFGFCWEDVRGIERNYHWSSIYAPKRLCIVSPSSDLEIVFPEGMCFVHLLPRRTNDHRWA